MATDWEVVQVQLPEVVVDLSTVLDSLVGAMIAVLDVVRAVLDVVKAFLVGFIDPIAAIVQLIVDEIEGLLSDIRQLGVYMAGDFEVAPPFDSLLGGFTAYERRMVGRLIDRNDPTRPAFTSQTTVAAVFLYSSFDTSDMQRTLAFLAQVRKFFGLRGTTRGYTVPTGLEVTYGSSSTGIGAFGLMGDILGAGELPTVANLRWQMAPPAGSGVVSWPLPSPPGFLVEVSTVPDGLFVGYQTPVSQAQSPTNVETGLVSGADGRPFKLFGGVSILSYEDLGWLASGTTYYPPDEDGATQLFAYRSMADNVPIPLNALLHEDKPILQRAFFVDVNTVLGINVAAPGQPYTALLRYEDMPYDATFESNADGSVTITVADAPAREVYVRVSAVTSAVTAGSGVMPSSFYWTLDASRIAAGAATQVQLGVVSGLTDADKSEPSAFVKVTFPSAQEAMYLNAVATALAVMVLSRSDLVAQGISSAVASEAVRTAQANVTNAPATATDQELSDLLDQVTAAEAVAASANSSYQEDTAAEATGLEDLARYLVPLVLGNTPSRFFKKTFTDVSSFRGKLRNRCLAVANHLLSQTGPIPSALLDVVLAQAEVTLPSGVVTPLTSVTWRDLVSDGPDVTILESLDPSTPEGSSASEGVAPNPISIARLDPLLLSSQIGGIRPLARGPGFAVSPQHVQANPLDPLGSRAKMNLGSADSSPVLYVQKLTPSYAATRVAAAQANVTNAPATATDQELSDLLDQVTAAEAAYAYSTSTTTTLTTVFCRNVFLATPSIFTASQLLLNIAASPITHPKQEGGAWVKYRLFPQGLPPVEAALGEIVGFLDAIQAGMTGISDAVTAYITFVQARILELEALLRRIEGLLGVILSIEVPAAAALVVTGQGTDGILQSLVTATNKPSDDASVTRIDTSGEVVATGTYGAGVVLLAGGLPSSVLEFLMLLFPPSE